MTKINKQISNNINFSVLKSFFISASSFFLGFLAFEPPLLGHLERVTATLVCGACSQLAMPLMVPAADHDGVIYTKEI